MKYQTVCGRLLLVLQLATYLPLCPPYNSAQPHYLALEAIDQPNDLLCPM